VHDWREIKGVIMEAFEHDKGAGIPSKDTS
jgi:hypothetical protein